MNLEIVGDLALFQMAHRSQVPGAEDDATMATAEMRERIQRLETKFDGLERKIDQLPTKADLSGFATRDDLSRFATKEDLSRFATKEDLLQFATKDDLVAFKDEIIKNFRILADDAKDSTKKAAEGYAGTLESIERRLDRIEGAMDSKFTHYDAVLKDHNDRIRTLEQ